MKRVELNVITGERVEIEQVAWALPDGSRVVLDADQDAPAGAVLVSAEQIEAERAASVRAFRIEALQVVVQGHLDAAARAMGYDDIRAAVTYADEPAVPVFQQQGQALRAWRSLVWARCYEILAEVEAATRPEPTAQQLVDLLPALELPGA